VNLICQKEPINLKKEKGREAMDLSSAKERRPGNAY